MQTLTHIRLYPPPQPLQPPCCSPRIQAYRAWNPSWRKTLAPGWGGRRRQERTNLASPLPAPSISAPSRLAPDSPCPLRPDPLSAATGQRQPSSLSPALAAQPCGFSRTLGAFPHPEPYRSRPPPAPHLTSARLWERRRAAGAAHASSRARRFGAGSQLRKNSARRGPPTPLPLPLARHCPRLLLPFLPYRRPVLLPPHPAPRGALPGPTSLFVFLAALATASSHSPLGRGGGAGTSEARCTVPVDHSPVRPQSPGLAGKRVNHWPQSSDSFSQP